MSHETHAHTDAPTRSDTLAAPTDAVQRRLRALRHLRPRQALMLATLVALVAFLVAAPATLSATLALLAATVTMLALVPYVAVRAAAGLA